MAPLLWLLTELNPGLRKGRAELRMEVTVSEVYNYYNCTEHTFQLLFSGCKAIIYLL